MTHADRVARLSQVSTALAQKTDRQLVQLIHEGQQLASGIGGRTFLIEECGTPVFGKLIRLTDLELRPENHGSTANLFRLPAHFHRNVGSPGLGAWRELAAHAMVTGWAVSRQLESVSMMYHWRVLNAPSAPLPDELANLDERVTYWGDSGALRARLTALANATACIAVFLEFFTWTLSDWLDEQLAGTPETIEAACKIAEEGLSRQIPLMNSLGLLHNDAHFGNILTDGKRLYFADFGLALSKSFALDDDEITYLSDNSNLDFAYVLTNWVNRLVKTWAPTLSIPAERNELVRDVASGKILDRLIPNLPSNVAAIILRYAPVAATFNDFYVRLHADSRATSYPGKRIEAMLTVALLPGTYKGRIW